VSERPFNVLFLCTGNSARSILAEQLLNHWGRGRFRGFSAGSHPKGQVHPIALELLRHMKLPTAGLRSKSRSEVARVRTAFRRRLPVHGIDVVREPGDNSRAIADGYVLRHTTGGCPGVRCRTGRGRHRGARTLALALALIGYVYPYGVR
jgi:hypothetical protein